MTTGKTLARAVVLALPLAAISGPAALRAADLDGAPANPDIGFDAPTAPGEAVRRRTDPERLTRERQARADADQRRLELQERNSTLLERILGQRDRQEEANRNALDAVVGQLPIDPRFDPLAEYSPEILGDLVTGSPLEGLSPVQLASFVEANLSRNASRDGRPSSGPSLAGDTDRHQGELLDGIVVPAEPDPAEPEPPEPDPVEPDPWAGDFPFFAAGHVTPAESLPDHLVAFYEGRLSGAFDDGTAVDGIVRLRADFEHHAMIGEVDFGDANGTASVLGEWPRGVNEVHLPMNGHAFGGHLDGDIDGMFYGPQAEEIGAGWSANIDGGPRDGQSLGGQLAAGQCTADCLPLPD